MAASAIAPATALGATRVGVAKSRNVQLLTIARDQLARLGEAIPHHDKVGIADFGLHASARRFHVVDLENESVRSFFVTHGEGSDQDNDGWLEAYSNVPNSYATSRGAYRTRHWYTGRYGTSMRLDGLDDTNSNALDRAIVMHAADYASPAHVKQWGRVGRSQGCLAMDRAEFKAALLHLVGGRLVFAETLGIRTDGSHTGHKTGNLLPLQPASDEKADRTRNRMLPGLF